MNRAGVSNEPLQATPYYGSVFVLALWAGAPELLRSAGQPSVMSRRSTITIKCCLVLFLAITAVPLAAAQLETKEVQLAALDEATIPQSVTVSSDCKRVAFVTRDEFGSWVVVDGVASKKYRAVSPPLLFSPDGKRVAYVAVLEPGKSLVVVNGREWPAVERLATESGLRLLFSPNSKHLALVCGREERNCVMLDGVFGQGYLNLRSLKFSPDGERLAYVAVPRAGKEMLVLDGTAGAEYEHVDGTEFSADGKHVAYMATRGDTRLVVLDGKEQKPYPYIAFTGSVEPGRESETVRKALFFSPDGNRLVYFAGTPDRWRLVEGKSEGEEFQSGGAPVFSPDSHNLAFRADGDERPFIVVNGAARALEGKALTVGLEYSPDAKRLAYVLVAANGRMRLVVNGVGGAEWDGIGAPVEEDGNNRWFSPDSQHLAYVAERAFKWCLVRDGVEGKPYHGIAAVRFSPNSKHLACLADVAVGHRVVIDGAEVPMKVTDRILAGLRWEDGNTYCTAVQRGHTVIRLEVTAR